MMDGLLIDAYFKSLDESLLAFLAGDESKYMTHCRKWDIPIPADSLTRKLAAMKAITGRESLPMEARSEAKRFLLLNNSEPLDDGDVPV